MGSTHDRIRGKSKVDQEGVLEQTDIAGILWLLRAFASAHIRQPLKQQKPIPRE